MAKKLSYENTKISVVSLPWINVNVYSTTDFVVLFSHRKDLNDYFLKQYFSVIKKFKQLNYLDLLRDNHIKEVEPI